MNPEWSRMKFQYSRFEYDQDEPQFIKCIYCNNQGVYYMPSDDRFKCVKCNKKFSTTSKTWLDNTKLSFIYWDRASWLLGKGFWIGSEC